MKSAMHFHNSHRRLFYIAAVATGLAAFVPWASTQEEATPTEPAGSATVEAAEPAASPSVTQEPQAPTRIGVVDVAIEANKVSNELQSIRSETVPDFVVQIAEELPVLDQAVLDLSRRISSARKHSVGTRWLTSIQESVGEIEPKAESWQNELQEYAASLRDKGKSIDSSLTIWSDTLANADADVPDSIKEEIQRVIDDLNSTKSVVNARLESALGLQSNLAGIVSDLDSATDRADSLMTQSRASLFQPDSPPIWKILTDTSHIGKLRSDIEEYSAESFSSVKKYIQRSKSAVAIVSLLGVAAFVFLLRIRKRHEEALESNPRLEKTATLVRHPVAGAFIVAIITTPFTLADAPVAMDRLVAIVLLFPLFRLIPSLVPKGLRRMAYGTIVVYLVARVASVFPEGTGVARILSLVAALYVIAGGVIVLRPARLKALKSKVLKIAVQASVALMVGSILANVFGMAVLASLLAQGVARSVFVGLALLCGLVVLLSLYRLLAVIGPLQYVNSLRENPEFVDRQVEKILTYLAIAYWLVMCLNTFGVESFVWEKVGALLAHEIEFGNLGVSMGAILAFILAIWLAVMISRFLRFFLERDVLARVDLPRGVPGAISMMVHYAIITLGLVIALAAAGINFSQISIVIGALGVGIGFGLQNIVNNFISGLILIFERPISVGDKVQFGTTTGEVRRIGIRASVVKTFEGAEMIVPNGNLISNDLINWTLSDQRRRMDLKVGVAYGNNPKAVLEILRKVATETEGVMKFPEPFLTFDGFGESSLEFTVRCWASRFDDGVSLKSRLAIAVYDALGEAGIEIPFPQRAVHLRSIAPGIRAGDLAIPKSARKNPEDTPREQNSAPEEPSQ